jgi:HPr kinase/phosphorylase
MKILVKVLQADREFGLDVQLLAGEKGLTREITNARVQKPGLALAGYVDSVRPGHLQVIGGTEMDYLTSLDDAGQRRAFEGLCGSGLACIVMTRAMEPPRALLDVAEKDGVPVFRTTFATETFMNRVHNFLDEHLAPELSMHGVLLDVYGVGVMLTGGSGIGKSECALDLVLRGHRLVSDDAVVVKQVGRQLVGRGSPLTRHHMEVRGLGIINVKDLFGAASVREKKRVEMVVEMVEWQASAEYDRTGIDELKESILDIEVPKIRLPIRPGRNVASIVEVASRNHLLKLQGHHSAREFKEQLERRLAQSVPSLESE